jgi:hypothetical protein
MDKFQTEQKNYLIVDPPAGWIFGFPKVVYDEDVYNKDPEAWFYNNGYPKHLKPDYIRTWRNKID